MMVVVVVVVMMMIDLPCLYASSTKYLNLWREEKKFYYVRSALDGGATSMIASPRTNNIPLLATSVCHSTSPPVSKVSSLFVNTLLVSSTSPSTKFICWSNAYTITSNDKL
jgi:hypothetical protein